MAYGDNYATKVPSRLGIESKSLLNRKFYRLICAQIERSSPLSVLEVGAGHGFFAAACVDAGDTYTGLDSNELLVDQLHAKGYSVKSCTVPPLPYEDATFDVVYAGYFVEFLPDPRTVFEFFCECERVLRPGGVLAIVSSDYMIMGKEFWNVSYMAGFATTERRLLQLLFDSGFQHKHTSFFAGNLFGIKRYAAYLLNYFYPYNFLNTISGQRSNLNSRYYKLRVSFAEGLCVIGVKDSSLLERASVVF